MSGVHRPTGRSAVVADLRERLADALRGGGVAPPGKDGPVREWVGSHSAAEECPARAFAVEGDFVETADTAARSVALTALRSEPRPTAPPAAQVQQVLERPEELRSGLADWVRGLDRAGGAAVVAAATAWWVDAVALGDRRESPPRWQDPTSLRYRPDPWGVTLAATVDACRRGPSGDDLLVVRRRTGRADGRLVRRVALLWALGTGRVPTSVVLGHRDTLGRDRHAVHDATMAEAVAEAADAVRWAITPSAAPVVPNDGCRHCPLLEVCDAGRTRVASQPRPPFPPLGALQPGSGGDPTT